MKPIENISEKWAVMINEDVITAAENEIKDHVGKLPFYIAVLRISTLFRAIRHKDDDHQRWLLEAIRDHMMGKEVKRET